MWRIGIIGSDAALQHAVVVEKANGAGFFSQGLDSNCRAFGDAPCFIGLADCVAYFDHVLCVSGRIIHEVPAVNSKQCSTKQRTLSRIKVKYFNLDFEFELV